MDVTRSHVGTVMARNNIDIEEHIRRVSHNDVGIAIGPAGIAALATA
jgi:hypothetical protein